VGLTSGSVPDISVDRPPPVDRDIGTKASVARVPNTSSRNTPEPGALDFDGNYLGPASGISFLGRAWRRLNDNYGSSVPAALMNEAPQNASVFSFGDRPFSASSDSNIVLPSRQNAKELIDMYFNLAVVTYRLLHRGTIESWLSDLYGIGHPLSSQISTAAAGRAAVVFMVFAVARLHQEHTSTAAPAKADSQSRLVRSANQMLSIETGPPKVETVEAKFIQCLYLLSSSRANQSWYTFGITIQLITALGLHRKRTRKASRRDGGYVHSEVRKRVFWAAYTLDKYLSVMLGRPRHLHDDDIDQELPDEVNDEDMTIDGPVRDGEYSDCETTAFIFHIKLIAPFPSWNHASN
jgi:hypothetical protein